MSANTDLIKRAYSRVNMTQDEIIDLANCIQDPKYFAKNHCFIQHPTKGRMPFDLFEYQERLIDTYHNYRYSISMLPRQSGKSTTAASYLLWFAMFNADSTILVAAHKYSGAQEIMSRIRYMYESCPDHIRTGATAYNKGSIEFDNGSRIIAQATTENTGRGLSLTLVYLDEFAYVRPRIASEFWTSLSPTLSTGGACLITSTPNQDDDQFARIWKQAENTTDEFGNITDVGINGFKSFIVNWNEHPDRDEEWAAQERSKIGEERFRREFNCEFIAFDETLVDSIFLFNMVTEEVPFKKTGEVRWYHPVEDDVTYVIGLDPSLGTGGDPAAIEVYALPGMVQVAEWKHNKTPIQGQIKVLKQICEYIAHNAPDSEIYWSVENNTIGEAALVVIAEVEEENIPGVFLSEPKRKGSTRRHRKGFTTTHSSKLSACAKLKHWVETNKMTVKSPVLLRELKNFVAKGTSYAAKDGETDDLVMALILVVRMILIVSQYDEDLLDDIVDSLDDDEFDGPMPILF